MGEHRFITFGQSSLGKLVAVHHAHRPGTIRIFSARRMTRAQRGRARKRRVPASATLCDVRAESQMNRKRRRPKQSRSGCLLCKPNKLGKGMEKKLGHRGFGKLRKEAAADEDMGLAEALNSP